MSEFWETTVQFEIDNGNGKIKKTKEYYLVSADSAEAILTLLLIKSNTERKLRSRLFFHQLYQQLVDN